MVTPVVPTTLSLLALDQLLKLFRKGECEKTKGVAFFSMVERRKSMHLGVMKKYGKYPIFLKTWIPYLAEIEKMGLYRRPVGQGGRRSAAGQAYEKLWQEINTRMAG